VQTVKIADNANVVTKKRQMQLKLMTPLPFVETASVDVTLLLLSVLLKVKPESVGKVGVNVDVVSPKSLRLTAKPENLAKLVNLGMEVVDVEMVLNDVEMALTPLNDVEMALTLLNDVEMALTPPNDVEMAPPPNDVEMALTPPNDVEMALTPLNDVEMALNDNTVDVMVSLVNLLPMVRPAS